MFLLPRDVEGSFAFASLQSDVARSLLRRFGRTPDDLSTFYVVANHRSDAAELLSKSRAALFLLKTLGGMWSWAALLRVLPAPLLDLAYDAIVRNRYRLFGRYERCLAPAPEYRNRFLDAG
jgi:predicted DCC family thiol-disulfide oxidoreductase YuxK